MRRTQQLPHVSASLVACVSAAAFVAAAFAPAAAADATLSLNPKRPVIDVTRELRKPKRARKPAPARIRKSKRKRTTPKQDRVIRRTVVPTSAVRSTQSSSQSIEGVLRQELPPLEGSAGDNGTFEPQPSKQRLSRKPRRRSSRSTAALPKDAWRGVSMKRFEKISREYARRPRSRAVRNLWVRMFASNARPPEGAYNAVSFEAVRMQALYRLGALQEIIDHAETVSRDGRYAILNILEAKARIALADEETACGASKGLISESGKVPESQQRAFVEISIYCALRADDRPRASLMMELSRDRGLEATETFAVVDALTLGRTPGLPKTRRLALIPGKLMVLGGYRPGKRFFKLATPALLVALALDSGVDTTTRLAAAEQAAILGALAPSELREVYLSSERVTGNAGLRAQAVQQIDQLSRSGASSGRILAKARQALKASRKDSLYPVMAAVLGPDIKPLRQSRDAQALAETAVDVAAASGHQDKALDWAIFGSTVEQAGTGAANRSLKHWQMPINISDNRRGVPRSAGLKQTERLAMRGQFSSDVLHRLVTVLDSLGYIVPIPLWNKASNAPQPAGGYLPKTGVLAKLAAAAKERQTGHTLMLAIAALGPDGANKAHLIALGDSLRALRAAGLEDAAREIAFEMIYPLWPRQRRR